MPKRRPNNRTRRAKRRVAREAREAEAQRRATASSATVEDTPTSTMMLRSGNVVGDIAPEPKHPPPSTEVSVLDQTRHYILRVHRRIERRDRRAAHESKMLNQRILKLEKDLTKSDDYVMDLRKKATKTVRELQESISKLDEAVDSLLRPDRIHGS